MIPTPKPLVEGVTVNATNQDVLVAATNARTWLTQATAHNTDSSARTLTVWVGASATDGTMRFSKSLAAGETASIDGVEGTTMSSASKVIMVADVAAKVSVRLVGVEFPGA